MSTKTTYICDVCNTIITGAKASGPVRVDMYLTGQLNRVFGTSDSHICEGCLQVIKDKYQDFINSIKLTEVKK